MSRRQRKRAAEKEARKLLAPPPSAPRPEPPRPPLEELLLAAGGMVERLAYHRVSREELLSRLAGLVVRVCRGGDVPDLAAASFFVALGEAIAKDSRFGSRIQSFERHVDALRTAFHVGWFDVRTKDLRYTTDEDRRMLRLLGN